MQILKGSRSCSILIPFFIFLLSGGCATLPSNSERSESLVYQDTDLTRLGRGYQDIKPDDEQSGFVLLGNGLDALVARAALAEAADRSIDAQYYMVHKDLAGLFFIDRLINAADRGVRVRLLLDDIDLGDMDTGLARLDVHPNIEIRVFNPFSRNSFRGLQFITRIGSVTRRMHNKSFTVDNQATIVGGRNIGDEYFMADPELHFSDLDVLAVGPVVKEVSSSFDQYWNHQLSYPITTLTGERPTKQQLAALRGELLAFMAGNKAETYKQALADSDLANSIRANRVEYEWGEAQAIYDRPEKLAQDVNSSEYHLSFQLGLYMEGIHKELIIISPYFVPGKRATRYLVDLCNKGVRVLVLTNSLASTDVGLVHAGYARYRTTLLRGGVELYEVNMKLDPKVRKRLGKLYDSLKVSLHTKAFIIDRQEVFIGSFNFDPRSAYENTEIGIMLNSSRIAEYLSDTLDDQLRRVAFRLELYTDEEGIDHILWHGLDEGVERTFTADPYTGFWRRLGLGFMGMLPIESQL